MSAPTSRDDGGNVPASVLSMIVEGLREVKESVARLSLDMNSQWSKLPEQYVPRREVEHRLDEHTIDIAELRAQLQGKTTKHDADVRRVNEAIEAIEERRKADEQRRQADRRWLVGILITVAMLTVAVLSLILSQTGAGS